MRKSVIYQVLPRLFGNTLQRNIKCGTIEENGCGKFNDFTATALNEIKNLGVTHIWYTGIIEHAKITSYQKFGIQSDNPQVIKGMAGSPYAIKDYYDVDPDLAENVHFRMQEFESLVTRTHQAGMKVIIDFVPNHVARHYHSDMKPASAADFGSADNPDIGFSPSNNFYYLVGKTFKSPLQKVENAVGWIENPAKVTGNDCMLAEPTVYDWFETVKLNYGVNIFNGRSQYFDPIPDTWLKMKDILLYWASKNVDGFRCDMAEMVPLQFWNWVIREIKSEFPETLFIAEVYNPSLYHDFIHTGGFDLLYDKVGMYDTLRQVVQNEIPVERITQSWEAISKIHHNILFFTENHDEQRLASKFFAGSPEKGWPATFVAATINSNPFMLYFGQEVGVDGMDDEGYSGIDGRTTIFDYWGIGSYQNWVSGKQFDGANLTIQQQQLRQNHQWLLRLIHEKSAIYAGEFYDLLWFNRENANYNDQCIYSYLRHNKESVLLFVVNFSNENQDIRLRIPDQAFHLSGLKDSAYYKSADLMNSGTIIQFPGQIALNGGIGMHVKGFQTMAFQLK